MACIDPGRAALRHRCCRHYAATRLLLASGHVLASACRCSLYQIPPVPYPALAPSCRWSCMTWHQQNLGTSPDPPALSPRPPPPSPSSCSICRAWRAMALRAPAPRRSRPRRAGALGTGVRMGARGRDGPRAGHDTAGSRHFRRQRFSNHPLRHPPPSRACCSRSSCL